jgi:hypothetical protein
MVVFEEAILITWVRGVEVLLAESMSSWYTAVIDKDPEGRLVFVSAAIPPTILALPIPASPFLNTTVPVGANGPSETTVALSVTALP